MFFPMVLPYGSWRGLQQPLSPETPTIYSMNLSFNNDINEVDSQQFINRKLFSSCQAVKPGYQAHHTAHQHKTGFFIFLFDIQIDR